MKCGVEEPELIIDRLCVRCFIDEGRAVKPPNSVEVVICPICGSVKYGSKWLESVDLHTLIKDLILRNTKLHRDFKLVSLDVSIVDSKVVACFRGSVLGIDVSKDYSIDLIVSKVLCQQCSRIKSGYYEALIQVRTLINPLRDHLRDRIDDMLRSTPISRYISEIEHVKEGVNVKVVGQGIARKLANDLVSMYGGTILESWKGTTTSSSGRKTSKLTISVKLVGLLPGDFIVFKDRVAVVDSVSKDLIKVLMLDSGELVKLRVQDLVVKDLKLLRDDEYELVDVYVDDVVGGRVLVKELVSGKTYELPTVSDVKVGSKVKLLIYRDRIYLVSIRK